MKFHEVQLPSNRKFGCFFAFIFALAAGYLLFVGSIVLAGLCFAISIAFILASIILPEALLPLNKLWMRFGLLLGMIVSPVVLGAIFFLMFTPIGFFMRLFGRDELRLRQIGTSSHWKERVPSGPSSESFKNQF